MTQAEYYEIMGRQFAYVEVAFEFWLTATFAILVAFHFAGNSIGKYLRTTTSLLYAMLTASFLARQYTTFFNLAEYSRRLADAGFESPPFTSVQLIIPFSYTVVALVGFIATIYFVLRRTGD